MNEDHKKLLIEQLQKTGQQKLIDWLFAEEKEEMRKRLQNLGHFDFADELSSIIKKQD